jgi:hypothetical protein
MCTPVSSVSTWISMRRNENLQRRRELRPIGRGAISDKRTFVYFIMAIAANYFVQTGRSHQIQNGERDIDYDIHARFLGCLG